MREVIKTNDEKLHGINLRIPGVAAVPTIYLEDCLMDYERGMPVKDIAGKVIDMMIGGLANAPRAGDFSLKYEDIEDRLVLQVV